MQCILAVFNIGSPIMLIMLIMLTVILVLAWSSVLAFILKAAHDQSGRFDFR